MAWVTTSNLNGMTNWHGPGQAQYDETAASLGREVRETTSLTARCGITFSGTPSFRRSEPPSFMPLIGRYSRAALPPWPTDASKRNSAASIAPTAVGHSLAAPRGAPAGP